MKNKEPIPVTVLTGFLGAGKTTLLNHLLSQPHGFKCAIIINEFGEISIDNQLVVGADEEIVELSNGCICCRVRGDLIKSLQGLFQKKKRFDYILIETTGLADPGPVAQTFYLPEMGEKMRLDAIVTVTDARHLEKELKDAGEARSQIAFADIILLNKTDLVSGPDLNRLEMRLREMNPLAKIHRTNRSTIDPARIFNVRARDVRKPLNISEVLGVASPGHPHNDEVGSFVIVEDRPLDLKKMEKWLTELLNKLGPSIYRSKGILYIKGDPKRVVFQGVQMMFEALPERLWKMDEKRQNQLVFIGRDLDEKKIREEFLETVAS